jgi:Fic family protein
MEHMFDLLHSVQPFARSTKDPQATIHSIERHTLNFTQVETLATTYAAVYAQQMQHLLIFNSNQFEGSKLTNEETTRMLLEYSLAGDGIKAALAETPRQVKGTPPPAKREVLQHLLAVHHLCATPVLPLTEETIRKTHALLMDGLLDADKEDPNAGHYRTEAVSVKGRLFLDEA